MNLPVYERLRRIRNKAIIHDDGSDGWVWLADLAWRKMQETLRGGETK